MSLSLLSVVLSVKAFVLSMVLSAGFLVVSIFAMRRQRLREHTALLWLLVSVVMVFVSVTLPTNLLTRVSRPGRDRVPARLRAAPGRVVPHCPRVPAVAQPRPPVGQADPTGPGDRAPHRDVAAEPGRRGRGRRTGRRCPPAGRGPHPEPGMLRHCTTLSYRDTDRPPPSSGAPVASQQAGGQPVEDVVLGHQARSRSNASMTASRISTPPTMTSARPSTMPGRARRARRSSAARRRATTRHLARASTAWWMAARS